MMANRQSGSARTRWTGGQYSIFRALFGGYLTIHFAHLLPWCVETFSSSGVLADRTLSPLIHAFPNLLAWNDSPGMILALVTSAMFASITFALGAKDKLSAIWIWYVLACLFGRNPLTANPSLPFVGWVLLMHCLIPAAPFGSIAARRRIDPAGDWRFPPGIFLAAWALMASAYSYSGYTKLASVSWIDGTAFYHLLSNPLARPSMLRELLLTAPMPVFQLMTWGALALELLYLPLAVSSRVRPWIWALMLGMHLGLIVLIDFADLSFGMVLLHLFTFDPAWIRARVLENPVVFYDGDCGFCHASVRWILAEDTSGHIRFSAIGSESFQERTAGKADLPDSLILATERELLVRSDAIVATLVSLGGWWRCIGTVLRMVPRALRDRAYDGIAGIRKRIFTPPGDACPILPRELRERFLPR